MAKRYIRLNWQNKPSTATPVSAANLNKMDKGIDDLDNAIEEIYAKRVNNTTTTNNDTFLAGPVGKNLQDQITTINNNLAGLKLKRAAVSNGNPLSFSYTESAYIIGGRADIDRKAQYFFDRTSGITVFSPVDDFTVTCENRMVTITTSIFTSVYLLIFYS